jgi:hypothetical protein
MSRPRVERGACAYILDILRLFLADVHRALYNFIHSQRKPNSSSRSNPPSRVPWWYIAQFKVEPSEQKTRYKPAMK